MTKNEEILEELRGISPFLASIPRVNVFRVPQSYFTLLPLQIIEKVEIKADEVLFVGDGALKKNPYSIPNGYFDGLADNILSKVAQKPAVKVVSMQKRAWRYATAAVMVGIILFSAIFLFNPASESTSVYTATIEKYNTSEKISEGIASLGDEDIVQYLQNHGNIMDIDNLMNDVDETELPSLFDYITNEDALNAYLNKINS